MKINIHICLAAMLFITGCANNQINTSKCFTTAHSTDFNAALGIFRQANFLSARDAFTTYIEKFPNDPLVTSAYFWKGSAQYALHQYSDAVTSFSKVIDSPRNRYAPEALLTTASINFESNNPSTGKANLEHLITLYPDSEAAVIARNKLGLQAAKITTKANNISQYFQEVTDVIRENIFYNKSDYAVTQVLVQVNCDGSIKESKITKSSGNTEWDEAVMQALEKTKYLPQDGNGLIPPQLSIRFQSQ